jgi:hypothetical protein
MGNCAGIFASCNDKSNETNGEINGHGGHGHSHEGHATANPQNKRIVDVN